ncbi:hypothetical protein RIF23_13985 [Lipingzhangella sp. LS1_29]|uniref:Uncharacterized protein n=1 Tax=Lipingzhangella rawalii TaxID=2055835 RepID=A0ABU2H7W5_9ACTN|nr:hypothetical protein [Lipingzhangella rawalii]
MRGEPQLGRIDAVYTHITSRMRTELCESLADRVENALRAPASLSPAVAGVRDAQLREAHATIISQTSPTDTKKAVTPSVAERE